MKDAQAVRFEGKLYVGGGTAMKRRDSAKIYVYTPAKDSWHSAELPVSHFALAVYRSQIVLVGGRFYCGEEEDGPITNQIFVLPKMEYGQCKVLCEMKFQRCGACATSIESRSESILIITGGEQEASATCIEIFNGKSWFNLSRPSDLCDTNVAVFLHNGDCYLWGGKDGISVFSAPLASLEAIWKPQNISNVDEISISWRKLPSFPKQVIGGCLTAFGSRLLVQNGGIFYAYSPYTCLWVHVLNIPTCFEQLYYSCVVVLSTGDLMMIGGVSSVSQAEIANTVIKASVDVGMFKISQ